MGIRLSDLSSFLNKEVVVQVDSSDSPQGYDDFYEVTGKVLATSPDGLVVRTKSGTRIIEMHLLLDVEEVTKNTPRRLIKRWIREVEPSVARQHLIDRHGMWIELVHALDDAGAVALHEKINHSPLGHGHGAKPPGKRGRKRKVTPQTEQLTIEQELQKVAAELAESDVIDEAADE